MDEQNTGLVPNTPRKPAHRPMTASFIILRVLAVLTLFGAVSSVLTLFSMGNQFLSMGLEPDPWYVSITAAVSVVAGVLMWQDKKVGILLAIALQAIALPITFIQFDELHLPELYDDNGLGQSIFQMTKWFSLVIGVAWIVGLILLMRARDKAHEEAAHAAELEF